MAHEERAVGSVRIILVSQTVSKLAICLPTDFGAWLDADRVRLERTTMCSANNARGMSVACGMNLPKRGFHSI
jgi:hypothetical protein